MTIKNVLLGATLAPILWAAPSDALSRQVQDRSEYSGTAMSIHWDTDHNGIKAGMGLVSGKSRLGRYTSQGVGEAVVAGPAICPNGNQGVNLTLRPGTGHSITRFDETGELLFSDLTSETVCYDPTTGTQFKSGTSKITGGTGRFAGATGEGQFEGTQWPLYVDADGNGFAAQVGTGSAIITLQDAKNTSASPLHRFRSGEE